MPKELEWVEPLANAIFSPVFYCLVIVPIALQCWGLVMRGGKKTMRIVAPVGLVEAVVAACCVVLVDQDAAEHWVTNQWARQHMATYYGTLLLLSVGTWLFCVQGVEHKLLDAFDFTTHTFKSGIEWKGASRAWILSLMFTWTLFLALVWPYFLETGSLQP